MAIDLRHNWENPWRWYHEELLHCCSDFNLKDIKNTELPWQIFGALRFINALELA